MRKREPKGFIHLWFKMLGMTLAVYLVILTLVGVMIFIMNMFGAWAAFTFIVFIVVTAITYVSYKDDVDYK